MLKIAIATMIVALALSLRSAYLGGAEESGKVPTGSSAPYRVAGLVLLVAGFGLSYWAGRKSPGTPK